METCKKLEFKACSLLPHKSHSRQPGTSEVHPEEEMRANRKDELTTSVGVRSWVGSQEGGGGAHTGQTDVHQEPGWGCGQV